MRHRGRMGMNPMGNDQFNSYRSGNYSSRYDIANDYSPSRNAYSRGESRGEFDRNANYGNSEYYSNQDRNDRGSSSDYGSRNRTNYGSSYGSSSYNRGRDNDRDWSDRAGDEVRSWFGDDDAERRRRRDDRRDNDSDNWFGRDRGTDTWSRSNSNQQLPSTRTRDNYDNDRTISSGRYNTSDDNYTGYGTTGRSGYSNVYGTSYGRDLDNDRNDNSWFGRDRDNDRYGSNRYGTSDRYDRDRSSNYDHDRGFIDKAGDEVRSWFGDEEAERRRRMDDLRDYDNDRDSNRGRNDSRRSSATYTSGPPYSYGSASRRDYEW